MLKSEVGDRKYSSKKPDDLGVHTGYVFLVH